MEIETIVRTYRIGELASMFGVTCRTIRYYEELGLIEAVKRENGGHRRYSSNSAIHLKRIQQLKEYGLGLAEISELFELARSDRSGAKVRTKLAETYRGKLKEAQKRKAAIDSYIDELSWHIEQLEGAQDFFDCPGSSCRSCPFAERCDMRVLADGA